MRARRRAGAACCRSTASTPRSPSACRAPPEERRGARADRLRRAVPRPDGRASSRRHRRRALAHPTWSMGAKITIDSATLMNKGLELIEAHHLFGVAYDQIEVVVHPQSIVHAMVRLPRRRAARPSRLPDMRVPISWALTHPDRAATPAPRLDLTEAVHARFRAARCGGVPLPRAGPGGRGGGRHCALRAERGERGRGGGVPGRSASVCRYPGVVEQTLDADRRRAARLARSRCSRPTRRARASRRAKLVAVAA